MAGIVIRKYDERDREEVLNICYRTGYMGDDLTGTGKFDDIKLFGYLFCFYYIIYESGNCFVAEDTENGGRIAGYIIGSCDTLRQEKLFMYRMTLRILLRLLFYTVFKYPESFSSVLHFLKCMKLGRMPNEFYLKYPAHLHMNVLQDYQRMGVGSMLIDKFEEHLRQRGVSGIHLVTSNHNVKAIPFYSKKGYRLMNEEEGCIWKNVQSSKVMIYAKML